MRLANSLMLFPQVFRRLRLALSRYLYPCFHAPHRVYSSRSLYCAGCWQDLPDPDRMFATCVGGSGSCIGTTTASCEAAALAAGAVMVGYVATRCPDCDTS